MKTQYLGLTLRSPVIVASSPYTSDADRIVRCCDAGAGAVVLKSIFEEQIIRQSDSLAAVYASPFGDTDDYLQRYLGEDYRARFLQLVADAKARVPIPVIASINCIGEGDKWIEYASQMAAAGADALELNVFVLPADRHISGAEVEKGYARIVRKVAEAVRIPVAVKLPMRFTNLLVVADALLGCGAAGVVLFNRFFEPDIDIERVAFTAGSPYSRREELRNVLRYAALCSAAVPQLSLAVSTGVHEGGDAVKALLCGADAVQICTAIHLYGYERIGEIGRFVDEWAGRHGLRSIGELHGRLDFGAGGVPLLQRVQYMKYFPDAED